MADLTITASAVLKGVGAVERDGIAGETITAGMLVYFKASDQKFWKALTTTAATANAVGIALCGASLDQPIVLQTGGRITCGTDGTLGRLNTVSDTAGKIADCADNAGGDFVTTIGVSRSATEIDLKFNATGIAHA